VLLECPIANVIVGLKTVVAVDQLAQLECPEALTGS
jgi:hypothetical protein